LCPLAFSLTLLRPLPTYRALIFKYKDNINKPDSSVGTKIYISKIAESQDCQLYRQLNNNEPATGY
jgi:hypothetical protein